MVLHVSALPQMEKHELGLTAKDRNVTGMRLYRRPTEFWCEHLGGDPAEEGPKVQHEEGRLPHPEHSAFYEWREGKHPGIVSASPPRVWR